MKSAIKICMIGNPDSIHVQRWARHFSQRGFDVSLLSYYQPRVEFSGNPTVHFLRARRPAARRAGRRSAAALGRFPGISRLVTATRLRAAGFYRELDRINPDVVHAHYVSDYGFLAALSRRHPMVVSAWGSDLLVDPGLSAITRQLVRWVLRRADLITYDADQVRDVARTLGASSEHLLRIVLGVDRDLLGALHARKVPPAERQPVILSLRSLQRTMYNVDVVIQAMPSVLARVPTARLLIGNDGSLRPTLEALAGRLGVAHAVKFVGMARGPTELAQLLGQAAVYVSVPSSDGTSVTLLEAMAAGAYPIVSDLAANREWVGGDGGAVVPTREVAPLAQAIVEGLNDPTRRASAAERNLELMSRQGSWDVNMARMEDAYRSLVEGGTKAGEETP
jgi:glycosyltransferase involved in cell wall biosynthesis